jgi:hypothetical protein
MHISSEVCSPQRISLGGELEFLGIAGEDFMGGGKAFPSDDQSHESVVAPGGQLPGATRPLDGFPWPGSVNHPPGRVEFVFGSPGVSRGGTGRGVRRSGRRPGCKHQSRSPDGKGWDGARAERSPGHRPREAGS